LHVAKLESIRKASKIAHVTPSALSKALAKLEDELQVKLFRRQGRHIRLTDQGRYLKQQAIEIIETVDATKAKLLGIENAVHVTICGQEMFLSHAGVDLGLKIGKSNPEASLEFVPTEDCENAIQALKSGQAHMAITMQKPDDSLFSIDIEEIDFVVCVGAGHELYLQAINNKAVSIKDVIKYPFASPMHAHAGRVTIKKSPDGWRDDKNPREIRFVSKSLSTIEKLVHSGQALAYLPDYLAVKFNVQILKLHDCPHSTKQKIHLVTPDPSRFGWLEQIN